MAEYDCREPRLATSSSLEAAAAVSTSQALPSSTSESMWEGWTQTSPVSQCVLTEQLQQHLGGGYSSSSSSGITSSKNGSSDQHDVLSSWLMSGHQIGGGLQQQPQHGGGDGSVFTVMYQDDFSRMNICSSTSSDYHGGATTPPGAGGMGWGSHQLLYDPVVQNCSSSDQAGDNSGGPTEIGGQSSQFLTTPPSDNDLEAVHKLDVNGSQTMVHPMHHPSIELSSRASSSGSGLISYGQPIQRPFEGQFDGGNYWASAGSPTAVMSSPSKLSSDYSGGGMRTSGLQREDQQPNTSCDSIILHHQHQHHGRKKGCEGGDVLFQNPGTDLPPDHMYAELHGLFGKILDTSRLSGALDHHHEQLAICGTGDSAAAGIYSDPSNWTQLTMSPRLSGASSQAAGFIGIQEVVDRTMLESSTADCLSTATHVTTRREESSPSSAGTAISTIHNFNSAAGSVAAVDLTHAALHYNSSSAKLDSSEMGKFQTKRQPSRGSEQVGDNVVSAEDSVKRSRVVRCLWEQNIAQLQLANLPSEHYRNLWQSQSQALFGRLPSNFLVGGSSSGNSGSMDMNTAVGPALNTNGRPRARRGSATDPQSVYARHRRERINDRLKVLQHLVPNGAKVDIVTMLEEAINYVKFLQLQVRLLSSDELWIYAPTTYNGVDVSMGMHAGLLNQQS